MTPADYPDLNLNVDMPLWQQSLWRKYGHDHPFESIDLRDRIIEAGAIASQNPATISIHQVKRSTTNCVCMGLSGFIDARRQNGSGIRLP